MKSLDLAAKYYKINWQSVLFCIVLFVQATANRSLATQIENPRIIAQFSIEELALGDFIEDSPVVINFSVNGIVKESFKISFRGLEQLFLSYPDATKNYIPNHFYNWRLYIESALSLSEVRKVWANLDQKMKEETERKLLIDAASTRGVKLTKTFAVPLSFYQWFTGRISEQSETNHPVDIGVLATLVFEGKEDKRTVYIEYLNNNDEIAIISLSKLGSEFDSSNNILKNFDLPNELKSWQELYLLDVSYDDSTFVPPSILQKLKEDIQSIENEL